MTTTRASEYLTRTELHSLTDYARCAKQATWLAKNNIPHRVDGERVIVSREHVKSWLEGRIVASSSGLMFGLNGQEQDALFLLKKAGANR